MTIDLPIYLAPTLQVVAGGTFRRLGSIEQWIIQQGIKPNAVEKDQLHNVGDFYFADLEDGYCCVVRLPKHLALLAKLTFGGIK